MYKVTLLTIILLGLLVFSLEYIQSQTLSKFENLSPVINTLSNQDMSQQSDDVLINPDGWTLPKLRPQQITKTYEIKIKDEFGEKRAVTTINYGLGDSKIYESFNMIGLKEGKIKIQSVQKYKKGEKIFAYLVTAQIAKRERNSINFTPFGPFFSYAFIDKDGDGKFEILLRTPSSNLIIPDWVLKD